MLEHIVKNGERIEQITELYGMKFDTIKSYNLHITDFNNLVCGMKIKIPLISEEIEQILENTESFVNGYYPKIIDIIDDNLLENKGENFVDNKPVEIKNERSELKGIPYPGIIPPVFIKKR